MRIIEVIGSQINWEPESKEEIIARVRNLENRNPTEDDIRNPSIFTHYPGGKVMWFLFHERGGWRAEKWALDDLGDFSPISVDQSDNPVVDNVNTSPTFNSFHQARQFAEQEIRAQTHSKSVN